MSIVAGQQHLHALLVVVVVLPPASVLDSSEKRSETEPHRSITMPQKMKLMRPCRGNVAAESSEKIKMGDPAIQPITVKDVIQQQNF